MNSELPRLTTRTDTEATFIIKEGISCVFCIFPMGIKAMCIYYVTVVNLTMQFLNVNES